MHIPDGSIEAAFSPEQIVLLWQSTAGRCWAHLSSPFVLANGSWERVFGLHARQITVEHVGCHPQWSWGSSLAHCPDDKMCGWY